MPPRDYADAYPLLSAYKGAGASAAARQSQSRADRIEGDMYAQTGTIGALTVRGKAKILESGALASGQTAYNTGTGFYLEANKGNPRFSLGNPSGNSLTWDGSALNVTGAMTATSGAIGGWTVNATNLAGGSATLDSSGFLNLGTGNNIVKASATDATYRLWVGNATPASAPFSVDKTGALSSSSGDIGGWSITSSALQLGSGATTRGIDSGSIAFYAGNATPSSAPFRVSTAGALTASNITVTGGSVTASSINTGTLNFGSSGTVNTTGSVTGTFGGLNLANLTVTGTITLGSGGSIVDADGSTWTQSGISLVSAGAFGDTIKWRVSGVDIGSLYANSANLFMQYKTNGIVSVYNDGATLQNNAGTNFLAVNGTSISGTSLNSISWKLGDAAGVQQFVIQDSGGNTVFGINSNGDLIRPIANDATALGAYYGRVPIFINGALRYLGVYN